MENFATLVGFLIFRHFLLKNVLLSREYLLKMRVWGNYPSIFILSGKCYDSKTYCLNSRLKVNVFSQACLTIPLSHSYIKTEVLNVSYLNTLL